MFEVKVCPRSKTEFDEAAKRRSCGRDKYGNSQYMCLPNIEKSSLVEFCYEGVMGIEPQGCCLEASSHQRVFRRNCTSFEFGCPDAHFWKYELYKYPACQTININDNCYRLDSACSQVKSRSNTIPTLDMFSNKPYGSIIILSNVAGVFAICCLFLLLFLIKKNKQFKEIRNGDEFANITTEIEEGEATFSCDKTEESDGMECFLEQIHEKMNQFYDNFMADIEKYQTDCGDILDKGIINFCFLELIQEKLDNIRFQSKGNAHDLQSTDKKIRAANLQSLMYPCSQSYQQEDQICSEDENRSLICSQTKQKENSAWVDITVFDRCAMLMKIKQLSKPRNSKEAQLLYSCLYHIIHKDHDNENQ